MLNGLILVYLTAWYWHLLDLLHAYGLWRRSSVIVWILRNRVWHRILMRSRCQYLLLLVDILLMRCYSKYFINWHACYLLSRQLLGRALLKWCELVNLLELSVRCSHVLKSYIDRWNAISTLHRPCRISTWERVGILCMIKERSTMALRKLLVMILDTVVIGII